MIVLAAALCHATMLDVPSSEIPDCRPGLARFPQGGIDTPEKQAPKISIITASLDALDDLRRTCASLQSQTYGDFEHIVIDGGSTDGTRDWLSETPGPRWISEPDSGIAEALNKGLAMATGDWILVLQAGDTLVSPTTLQEVRGELDVGSEVVCFDIELVGPDSVRRVSSAGFSPRLNFKPVPHQGVFTRRGLFESVGVFDETFSICMDYDFYLRAYRAGVRATAPGTLLARMPDDGISSRNDWNSLKRRFDEERRVHRRHANTLALRAMYSVWWPAYMAYRATRARIRRWGADQVGARWAQ